jgi:hypothetical protein
MVSAQVLALRSPAPRPRSPATVVNVSPNKHAPEELHEALAECESRQLRSEQRWLLCRVAESELRYGAALSVRYRTNHTVEHTGNPVSRRCRVQNGFSKVTAEQSRRYEDHFGCEKTFNLSRLVPNAQADSKRFGMLAGFSRK